MMSTMAIYTGAFMALSFVLGAVAGVYYSWKL